MDDQIYPYKKRHLIYPALFLLFTGLAAALEQPLLMLVPVVFLSGILVIQKPAILFFALVFLLPLSAEYMLTDSLGTDMPTEFLMILLSAIIVMLLVYDKDILPTSFYRHPLVLLLLIHFSWLVVATIFSNDLLLSLKFLLAKIWYIIPFVVAPVLFIKNAKAWNTVALCSIGAISFVVLQSIIRHSQYGFSFENINKTLQPFFPTM